MKGFLSIFMLVAVLVATTQAFREKIRKPNPNSPGFPSFPGQGPFNPKPTYPYPVQHRFRRAGRGGDKKNENDKGHRGQIKIEGKKEGGKTSYNVDYGHKIYENKHGSISVNGGVNKNPYSKPESHVGISGSFKF